MMANRSDLGRPNPKRPEHLECVKAMGNRPANPIRDSGQRPQLKSGCTGAICSLAPLRNEGLANRGRPCTVVLVRLRRGGRVMKLRDALDEVQKRDGGVIFAMKPWTLDSEADIFELHLDKPRPQEIADRSLEYFLEVGVAQETLEVFGDREPTLDEALALLLHYAEHDGFPDWVYERTGDNGSPANCGRNWPLRTAEIRSRYRPEPTLMRN